MLVFFLSYCIIFCCLFLNDNVSVGEPVPSTPCVNTISSSDMFDVDINMFSDDNNYLSVINTDSTSFANINSGSLNDILGTAVLNDSLLQQQCNNEASLLYASDFKDEPFTP